ncbi:hypothetical protein EOL96_04880 [Candidatus Saccharibacteria bacterium]|nr:hypothetical protein [Candidatus Saccharibacteria bacterium]
MGYFNKRAVSHEGPVIEQGEELVSLMYDTLGMINKDVKIPKRYPGKAFLLPGSVTEWSRPDAKDRVKIVHDRTYSASVRHVGDGAKKLIMLEFEAWYRSHTHEYYSERNMYRVEWRGAEMIDAQVLRQEMISPAQATGVAVPNLFRDDLVMEIVDEQRFDDNGVTIPPRSYRYLSYDLLTEVDLDSLLDRTQQFQGDLVSARGIAYPDAR